MARYEKGSTVDVKSRLINNHTKCDGGCWIWNGKVEKSGYGRMSVYRKPHSVHRLAYETFVGQIPEGNVVCHSCDNKLCINPDHLWVGTQQDNMTDKVSKDRQPKGETHGRARLTEADVLSIREQLASGISQTGIAIKYGVHKSTISLIANRKKWGWL